MIACAGCVLAETYLPWTAGTDQQVRFAPGLGIQAYWGSNVQTVYERWAAAGVWDWVNIERGHWLMLYIPYLPWCDLYKDHSKRPSNPSNPDDPGYDWSALDELLNTDAVRNDGVKVLVRLMFKKTGNTPQWLGLGRGVVNNEDNGLGGVIYFNSSALDTRPAWYRTYVKKEWGYFAKAFGRRYRDRAELAGVLIDELYKPTDNLPWDYPGDAAYEAGYDAAIIAFANELPNTAIPVYQVWGQARKDRLAGIPNIGFGCADARLWNDEVQLEGPWYPDDPPAATGNGYYRSAQVYNYASETPYGGARHFYVVGSEPSGWKQIDPIRSPCGGNKNILGYATGTQRACHTIKPDYFLQYHACVPRRPGGYPGLNNVPGIVHGSWVLLDDNPTSTRCDTGDAPRSKPDWAAAFAKLGPQGIDCIAEEPWNWESQIDPNPTPTPPADLTATATSPTQIALAWRDRSSNEEQFKIDRRQSGLTVWARIATLGADTTTHADPDLPAGTKFYYKVKAWNVSGNSPYSDAADATTQAGTPAPQIAVSDTELWATCEQGQNAEEQTFQVWNDAGGTLAYTIVENSTRFSVTPTDGTSTDESDRGTHTVTFTTDTLEVGTYERSLRIESATASNNPVTVTLVIEVTAPTPPPAAPTDLAACAIASTRIALAWTDAADDEDGFLIDRRRSGELEWVAALARPPADTTSYTDSNLPPASKFYYRVRAFNDGGDSAPCAPAYTTTLDGIAPGTTWRYRKGTAEASSPATAWRRARFDADGWAEGAAPFGYGDGPYGTELPDMRYNYSSLYMRRTFQVRNPAAISALELALLYDDGFVAWLNGQEIARHNVEGEPGTFLAFDQPATVAVGDGTAWSNTFSGLDLPALLPGTNVLTIQAFNVSLSNSSDFTAEAVLSLVGGPWSVAEDPDADGMPDAWEQACLSALSDPADRSDLADPDNDGLSNLDEYVTGTSPTNPASFFGVTVTLSNAAPTVSFPTTPAAGAGYDGLTRHYQLQRCSSPAIADWAPVPGFEDVVATGSPITFQETAPSSAASYRARVWLAE